MKIIRAGHMGMCFGVRDAIALAEETAKSKTITILGQLVHNEAVLERLRLQGIRFAESFSDVETADAMITAHGASDKVRANASVAGLNLVDTTCPLVNVAHRAVRMLIAEGYHPVIIGKRGHVEVRGLTEDLAECDIVLTEEEIERIAPRPKFGVCAQTTQPIARVQKLTEALRNRFPESTVRLVDTVCQPTKQRQSAAVELAKQCDVVVVVGGANSNNTRELVETCRVHCPRVHYVQDDSGLREEWFRGTDIVGLTAGTSTPDSVIQRVELALKRTSQNSFVSRRDGVELGTAEVLR